MRSDVSTYEGFKDQVLNLFYSDYGVLRPKMVTEQRMKKAYNDNMSAIRFVNWMAKEIGLRKL